MTYDFFADKADKLKILDFIFKDTDLHVYDSDSPYGQGICQYKTVDEISSKFDLDNGDKFAVTFQLWTPLTVLREIPRTEPIYGYCNRPDVM